MGSFFYTTTLNFVPSTKQFILSSSYLVKYSVLKILPFHFVIHTSNFGLTTSYIPLSFLSLHFEFSDNPSPISLDK